jgi:predicted phosphate transport protein (TIGR00153 family)
MRAGKEPEMLSAMRRRTSWGSRRPCGPGGNSTTFAGLMFGRPNEDAFFRAFSDHATRSVEAAVLLLEMLEHTDRMGKLALDIGEKESAGDRLTHETVKRLHETWITPLDRFDIHGLISRLDDVLDLIEAVSERLVLFEIRAVRPAAIELARVLLKGCEDMQRAMLLLPKLSSKGKDLLDICVEINRLENEADTIYRRAIAELFRNGNDPIEVMKWRDIFDNLEAATDCCEDVANIVEGVVLEYA